MTADELLSRCIGVASRLPEVTVGHVNQHASLYAAGSKRFAWFLNDHHGDGMICLCVKIDPEAKENLIDLDPARYLRPAYVSRFGWMSIRIDQGNVDWEEIGHRLMTSYRCVAPKRLVKTLDEDDG